MSLPCKEVQRLMEQTLGSIKQRVCGVMPSVQISTIVSNAFGRLAVVSTRCLYHVDVLLL